MRMAGNLLRNLLNAIKKRRDGKSADPPLAGKGRRMSLSARLILLLTIAVGAVMALGGYFILRQREEILARALRNELHAHAVTLQQQVAHVVVVFSNQGPLSNTGSPISPGVYLDS